MMHDDGVPWWFKFAWWVVLALSLGMTGLVMWLLYSATMWLAAHT